MLSSHPAAKSSRFAFTKTLCHAEVVLVTLTFQCNHSWGLAHLNTVYLPSSVGGTHIYGIDISLHVWYTLSMGRRKGSINPGELEQQIDLLVTLDLSLIKMSNEEKCEAICQALPWWDEPPSIYTLYDWRKTERYQQQRQEKSQNIGLSEQVQHWAGLLFQDKIARGYEKLLSMNPTEKPRAWMEAARDVRKMAGLQPPEAVPRMGALVFLKKLRIDLGQGLQIGLERQDDGTVIDGDVKVLAPSTDSS